MMLLRGNAAEQLLCLHVVFIIHDPPHAGYCEHNGLQQFFQYAVIIHVLQMTIMS